MHPSLVTPINRQPLNRLNNAFRRINFVVKYNRRILAPDLKDNIMRLQKVFRATLTKDLKFLNKGQTVQLEFTDSGKAHVKCDTDFGFYLDTLTLAEVKETVTNQTYLRTDKWVKA